MRSVAATYIKLFLPEGVIKAFNLFAIKKLSEDIAEVQVCIALFFIILPYGY